MMNKTAVIIIKECTRNFDKEYDYIVPEEFLEKVKKGVRVIVPFGASNRLLEGFVLSIKDTHNTNNMKSIHKVIDSEPILTDEMIEVSRWMKGKYICTWADAIKCFMPAGTNIKTLQFVKLKDDQIKDNVKVSNKSHNKIVEYLVKSNSECEVSDLKKLKIAGLFGVLEHMKKSGIIDIIEQYTTGVQEKYTRVAFIIRPHDEIIEAIEGGIIRTIQQIRVLEMLLDNEYIATADIVKFSGVSPSVLNTLKKNGYIDFKEIEVIRDPLKDKYIERTFPLNPTPEQADVIKEVVPYLSEKKFSEMLIHGVTGSGKTEVYLQLIQHAIEMGREAIVMVPEISLTPQMVERFKGRFGDSVAVLHSRLSLGERYDQWRLIFEGEIKVAVGARSAVFAPFKNIGIIIIDEEHENTYKSEVCPKYTAHDIARKRCELNNAVLLYGSATPSIENYYRAQTGEIKLLEMSLRANNQQLPEVELIDMRKELKEGNRTIFSHALANQMQKNIQNELQTILFLNRRGHSSFVLCRDCGFVIKCRYCNISLTYHDNDKRLTCHYCGYTVKNPNTCPKCKSINIRYFGVGTQKVEEEVKKAFPNSTVLRMDMDTTNYKNAHELILDSFKNNNINTLVGTQMVAKGHDFPKVTLVGVIAADSLLNTGDYRATERTFQLITQVAGRAGRGKLPGKVIVQTYNTEDFSIKAATKHDYKEFYKQEILIRRSLMYPPFTNIAVVLLSGSYDKSTYYKAEEVKKSILELKYAGDCQILGPARSPLSRIKNRYRWRIVIKCNDIDKLIFMLTNLSDEFYKAKNKKNILLSVDINPVNLM